MTINADPHDRSTAATRSVARMTGWIGSAAMIVAAGVLVTAWLVGALFIKDHLANSNYLIGMNTITSLLVFVMVFVVQNRQNRDGRAIQAKLDAQNKILEHVADRLGIDHQELLTDLVGVEEAPEPTIRAHQELIRRDIADARRG